MKILKTVTGLAAAAAVSLFALAASAQTYPERNITMVVPFSAGGPTDTVARLVAESMSKDLGQQDIGRVSGSTRASISSALATLESRGLVTRERVETDRRQLVVELTAEGRETLRLAIEAQTKRERAWTGVLRDDQLGELVHLLRTLVNQETPPAE